MKRRPSSRMRYDKESCFRRLCGVPNLSNTIIEITLLKITLFSRRKMVVFVVSALDDLLRKKIYKSAAFCWGILKRKQNRSFGGGL